jgi:coatomer subunit beta'
MALQIVQDFYLVRYCIFIAREHWIVVGDGYGYIHVRSCKALELDEVKKFKGHQDWIQALAVHPSLPLVVSGCSDTVIKLWNWEQEWACIRTFKGHTNRVECLMFNPHDESPDYVTFASASLDSTAKV